MHKKAHDPYLMEKRGDPCVVRSLPVASREMGISGQKCDVVEFHKSEDGIKLHGHRGLYSVYPVEYKKGKPKITEEDRLQLTAQALCLEEMLSTEVPEGAVFYGETRRRETVEITESSAPGSETDASGNARILFQKIYSKGEIQQILQCLFSERNLSAEAGKGRLRERLSWPNAEGGAGMKKLLNTLYVTSENSYLALDGENVVVLDGQREVGRLPLHNLEGIVSFGYRGTSPALMGACADRNISLCYLTPQGKFLARISGKIRGNVLLRQQQYDSSRDEKISLGIAKNCILGKVYNARWVLERAVRDHSLQVDTDWMKKASEFLKNFLEQIQNCSSKEQLRGYEGEAASVYFSVFDQMILQQKKEFSFQGRNKRPPMDNINALLSFIYTLLTNNIVSALECVGLDPYVGYLHTDRPGRASLALDLIEEFRAVLADRFVLSLINKKIISGKGFVQKENGAVLMNEELRKKILTEWQNKKKESITHPFLKEKVEWGMVPYVQAMLLARYLRGDLDGYPVFLWK